MSLVKKLTMTENKLATNRSNGGHSQGPATEEGMEICATARRRHGLYAQAQETALLGLGEDPADFEELLDGVRKEFTPASTLQKRLVNRLARCFGSWNAPTVRSRARLCAAPGLRKLDATTACTRE